MSINRLKVYLTLILFGSALFAGAQPAIETIKLTGTLNEEITINISGEKHTIKYLPYEFTLKQEQIPMTIIIESPNYDYRTVFIPKYTKKDYKIAKQTGDLINRTYLVYGEKKAQQAVTYIPQQIIVPSQQQVAQEQQQTIHTKQEKEIKFVSEIDKAPINEVQNDANTFAIIIANEEYIRESKVPYSLNDGEIFALYCKNTLGLPEQNVRLVKNATLNDMKYNLNWLKQVMEAYQGEAKVIFYYAGHGIPDEAEKTAYLLPVDGYAGDVTTGYSLSNLYTMLGECPAKSVSVFLDACFSGAKREGDMLVAARGVVVKIKESVPRGNMVVFSASQGDETAYPYKEQQHGMFTYYLLKKLQESNGEATLGEIAEYVTGQVRKQSIVINGKMQTPTMIPSLMIGEKWKTWTLK